MDTSPPTGTIRPHPGRPSLDTVVFSMGDPHGIGPEVLLKAVVRLSAEIPFRPVVFGATNYLERLMDDLGLQEGPVPFEFRSVSEYAYPPPWGTVSREAGTLAKTALLQAIECCVEKSHALLVTAPVNKQALQLAGFPFPGQTEFIGSFFEGFEPAMAFFSDRLHLILATVHLPLRQVFQHLSVDGLVGKSRLFHRALSALGYSRPRIAVCGLNPHASESGLMGDEEARLIEPALKRLREAGLDGISGPHPPDTVFRRAVGGEFDGVVALYHDQGLIPLKLVAFESAVNTTLGLPLLRTSPDHGTAFDLAGRSGADPSSMIAAIRWGLRLAAARLAG